MRDRRRAVSGGLLAMSLLSFNLLAGTWNHTPQQGARAGRRGDAREIHTGVLRTSAIEARVTAERAT